MRKLYSLLVSSLLFSNAFAQVPTNGLVGEYLFTNGSLSSTSGAPYTGSQSTSNISNSADRFNVANNAKDVDPGGWVSFGDVFDGITTGTNATFAYSFWVKLDAFDNAYRCIFAKATFESTCGFAGRQYAVLVNPQGKLQLQAFGAITGGHARVDGHTTLTVGEWHHIVISVDMASLLGSLPSTVGLNMYVDGVLQTNTVSEIAGIGISTNGMDDGPAPLGFGTYLTVTGNGIESCVSSQNINGQLDDFRIYDRVITSQEATQLLNESNVPCDPAVVTSVDIAETCEGYSTITVLLHVFAEEVSMEYFNGTNWVPDSGVWLESDGIVHHVYQTGQYRCKAVMECGEISYSNDIVISSFPIVPSITIFGNTSVCSGSNLNLTSTYSGPGTPTYQWSTGATDFNATDNPTQSTIYSLTITSPQGCSATDDHEVTVLDLPEPVITESGGVLTASGGPFQSHQWYLEGNSLGVVVGTYTPTQAGNYTVSVTQGPCTGTSPVFNYNGIPTGIQNLEANGLNVYPNPFANEFVIETTNPTQIRVINALGETILSRTINGRTSIDATSLATGIYFVQEETSGAVMKLVKH